jgi:hypothetical protein
MNDANGFSDVDIRVENSTEPGRYPVAIDSSAGDASGTLVLNVADETLQQALQAIENSQTDESFFLKFGRRLFEALLPDQVAMMFRTALGHARGAGDRLRVRLRLRPPELSALPWEFLYDPQPDLFLAISSNVILSRYVVDAASFAKPMTVTPPLRVLVAFSSPPDLPALNLEQERALLTKATRRAVDEKRLELHFLDHTTNASLRSALRDTKPHVFHFAGHGHFDGQRGYLLFEDEFGEATKISDRALREFFEDAPEAKLVVLNACQGAAASAGDAFSGLAPNLVQRGLPAVVAMRYPVPDRAALIFAREFYEALTQPTPTAVDVAAAAGRRAIYQDLGPDGRNWGIPNVYLRAEDGNIFAPPAAAEEEQESSGVTISNISNSNINIGSLAGRDIKGKSDA